MRKLGFAVMTLLVAGFAGSAPAMAHDYPWCAQGWGLGYPGECSYQTYGQCMASASGRNLGCGINPRVAFARERRGRPLGQEPYRTW